MTDSGKLAELMAGMIVCWGGQKTSIPAGWHECDGTLLQQSQYPTLYNAIGTAFGSAPPSGQFYLPDLRGQFVRGVDDGASTDPDLSVRHDMQNASLPYSGVGSVQPCALQVHQHGYNEVTSSSSGTIDNAKAYDIAWVATGNPINAPTSDNETRPVNAALYYIINLGLPKNRTPQP